MLKSSKHYKIVAAIGVAVAVIGTLSWFVGMGFLIGSAKIKQNKSQDEVTAQASAGEIGGEIGMVLGGIAATAGSLTYAVCSERYKTAKKKEENENEDAGKEVKELV